MTMLQKKEAGFNLTPANLTEAMQYAELIAKSSLVPTGYRDKPADVLVAVQMGQSVGLQPMQALQNIAVINGRPCLWGDAVLALVKASGLLTSIHEDISETKASCTVVRANQPSLTRSFSIDDAKRAGLFNRKSSPWETYPKRMMQMRARSFALRDAFPDVLLGLNIREEVEDYQPIRSSSNATASTPETSRVEALKSLLNEEAEESPKQEATTEKPAASLDYLKSLIQAQNVADETMAAWLNKANVSTLDDLPEELIKKACDYLERKHSATEDSQYVH